MISYHHFVNPIIPKDEKSIHTGRLINIKCNVTFKMKERRKERMNE